jgi:hypothetical protein
VHFARDFLVLQSQSLQGNVQASLLGQGCMDPHIETGSHVMEQERRRAFDHGDAAE